MQSPQAARITPRSAEFTSPSKSKSASHPLHSPAEPLRVEQRGCAWVPHVVAVRAGRGLLVSNDDPVPYNVHLRARRNPSSNSTQAAGAAELRLVLDEPELDVPLVCDLHPWMGAWVHVVDHPWFGVTERGAARIEGLPAGAYELEVRHETLGKERLEVVVEQGGTAELTVTFAVR